MAPWDLDAMPGTGDICSTAGDLMRFTAALHRGELVTASSLRAMCTAHATLDFDDDGEPGLAADRPASRAGPTAPAPHAGRAVIRVSYGKISPLRKRTRAVTAK